MVNESTRKNVVTSQKLYANFKSDMNNVDGVVDGVHKEGDKGKGVNTHIVQ